MKPDYTIVIELPTGERMSVRARQFTLDVANEAIEGPDVDDFRRVLRTGDKSFTLRADRVLEVQFARPRIFHEGP